MAGLGYQGSGGNMAPMATGGTMIPQGWVPPPNPAAINAGINPMTRPGLATYPGVGGRDPRQPMQPGGAPMGARNPMAAFLMSPQGQQLMMMLSRGRGGWTGGMM